MLPTDATLVEQCLKGEKEAFARIVERYQHRVFHLALIRMPNRQDADDLAQETFLQAYRKLNTFDQCYSFKTWLFTICVNLGKNRLRGLARRREVHHPDIENSASASGDGHLSRIDLTNALYKIPEAIRVPLVLKHLEGFSYEEIAFTMKIGLSAAKMRVKRGRDQLVKYLSA